MRAASRISAVLGLVAALAVLLAAAPAYPQKAEFKVIVVKATNDGDSMDTSLKKYAHLLRNRGYTNFKKIRTASFTLDKGGKGSFAIAGSLNGEIEYTSEVNQRVAFKCTVRKGDEVQTRVGYSASRGSKTMVIVRGPVGYMLIIEVS
jgi:hypothetical protein